MNARARSAVITGMAFPLGAMLGVMLGVVSAPRDPLGYGDVAWAMLWFIISGGPITMLAFWFSTRSVEWTWSERKRAMFRMAQSAFLATGLLIFALWFWGRSGNGLFVFVVLPLCAWLITVRARRIVLP